VGGRDTRREHNQKLFRRGNELLHDVAEEKAPPGSAVPFLCECAAADCLGEVPLTLAAWESVAAVPNHFVMLVGHQRSEGEQVVGTLGEFEIARKPD
jgi:hypothetical protein